MEECLFRDSFQERNRGRILQITQGLVNTI